MSMKKLTDSIGAKLREQTERAQEEHARTLRLAELWDKHCENNAHAAACLQPWIMHTSKLFGAIGSYSFRDATPEQCAELLAAFVPVPTAIVKTQMWTSFRPADYVDPKLGGGEDIKSKTPVPGGAAIGLDCSRFQSRAKVQWWTMLGGELVGLDVELATIHNVTPHMAARVEYADPAHNHISRVSDARPVYPIEPAKGAPLTHIRYSAGAPEYWPHILIHGHVAAYIEQLAGWCYSARRASKKAYQEDKIAGLPPVSGPASDQTYESQKLRAGTREQYECLHTEAARRDRALAEKHWKQYAEDYGIESTQGYFDHYAWACAYLKRQGLYEVPDPRDPSKAYKYGHAWL